MQLIDREYNSSHLEIFISALFHKPRTLLAECAVFALELSKNVRPLFDLLFTYEYIFYVDEPNIEIKQRQQQQY